jgi:hypothetical protein
MYYKQEGLTVQNMYGLFCYWRQKYYISYGKQMDSGAGCVKMFRFLQSKGFTKKSMSPGYDGSSCEILR